MPAEVGPTAGIRSSHKKDVRHAAQTAGRNSVTRAKQEQQWLTREGEEAAHHHTLDSDMTREQQKSQDTRLHCI